MLLRKYVGSAKDLISQNNEQTYSERQTADLTT